MSRFGIFIEGKRGNIGRDLALAAQQENIQLCEQAQDAEFIALCIPAAAAQDRLSSTELRDKIIIDFSGASKRNKIGQYGLMLSNSEPWDQDFDPHARVFGNPGCIASAVLRGMDTSGIRKQCPNEVSIFAVGGSSYAHDIDNQEIRLAKRLIEHPHVPEIATALGGLTKIASFMPAISGGVDRGLLVGISGSIASAEMLNHGQPSICVSEVAQTANLRHRLEINPQPNGYNFSLAVAIDNLRFVTKNAVDLMKLIVKDG